MIAEVTNSMNTFVSSCDWIGTDAFWGIIGTLLGTILGWLLNELTNKGRLHFYLKSWEASMDCIDGQGGYAHCKDRSEIQFFTYNLCLEIYNSSNKPRIIRSLDIAFCKGKKSLIKQTPENDSTGKSFGSISLYKKVGATNIPANEVITLVMHGNYNTDQADFSVCEQADNVYLEYKNEHNRIKRIKLTQVRYDSYFDIDTEDT